MTLLAASGGPTLADIPIAGYVRFLDRVHPLSDNDQLVASVEGEDHGQVGQGDRGDR